MVYENITSTNGGGAIDLTNQVVRGNWDWDEGSIRFEYGMQNTDLLGENGHGAGQVFEIGGQTAVRLDVDDNATPGTYNVNKLDATLRIVNNNLTAGYDGYDAIMWGERRDEIGGIWAKAHFSDVRIVEEGAEILVRNRGGVWSQLDLTMETNGTVWMDNNEGIIGTVDGNPDVAGNETLEVVGWSWSRYNGLIGGDSPVNVVAVGNLNPDGWDDWIELRQGFEVAPGSRWTRGQGDRRIMVYENITSPNGGGIIDLTNQVVRADWWYDEGSMRIEYGMGNGDLNGDNGHGAGQVIEAGGQQRFRIDVDDNATPGTFNVNKFDATINVVNNVAGYDVFLHSERRADIGGIWAKAQFSDVHIVEEGAEIRVQTSGGSWIETDITLDGVNGRISNWDSPDREIIKVTSADARTLTIDTRSGDAGSWTTPQIDLTLNGAANAEFDATGGGAFRVLGMHLNGQTVTVKRSSASGGVMVEMWPECNNDPNGLIDILGWDDGAGGFQGNGLQVRVADVGGIALTGGTQVQIHNNQVLGGFVQEHMVQAVQEFEAGVKVMASVTDTDAILRSVKSDVADTGDTPGMVKFDAVTMESGSKAELQINDNTRMFLADVTLEGDAEIWQNSTQTRAFIGDVGGTGTLTIAGSGWTRLVGDIAAAVNLNAYGVLQTTGTVSGTLNVNGVAIVQKAMAGDGINVNGGGVLAIADAGFTPGTMTIQNGGAVALLVNNSWTDDSPNWVGMNAIMIAKDGYTGTLTLNRNDTVIGGEWTDRASLTSALTGT
ncbi:MAG: hypothetical protein IMZ55_03310, partial [Acidobacteria bacterium]|nr:hypothetical protein [Acidobacteriota bacterium]